MGPAVLRIISALMRYGKTFSRYAKQSGTRVSGRTSKSGAKVRGVLKTQPGRRKKLSGLRWRAGNRGYGEGKLTDRGRRSGWRKVISGRRAPNVPVVESASGGRTIINPADASRLRAGAAVASKVRKGLVGGGVGGAGIVGFATGANKGASKKSEPIATEKNPLGMTFSAAPPQKKKQSFGQAFSKAREKGEGTEFSWQGKDYVAVTKDDLKKRGLKNLGEWQKRKKSIKTLKKKGLMMRKVSKKT